MTDRKAILSIDGQAPIELPVLKGTLGQDVIDIGSLGSHGFFTYDPGFSATAACQSDITYIDGDKGVLLHRGYPIEELAEKSDYLETCYLLLEGALPNAQQKEDFVNTITNHTMVNRSIEHFISGFRYDAHPMAMLCGVVGAMSSFYHDSLDITNEEHRKISAHRLIAKMPTIAAMCHKHFSGQPFIYPDNSLSYSENFLHMMFGTPCEPYVVKPAKAKDKSDPFRLMGFGHRVYKNYDPRATVMRESCDEVLEVLGLQNDPLFRLAKKLEKIALEDEYFVSKKLYPNVDFYSGIILKALGIPVEMFTVIFATGRTVGWISHWNEMITHPYRIGRPRQLYTGEDVRDYTPVEDR